MTPSTAPPGWKPLTAIQVNRYDAEGLRYEMEENGNLVQFIFNQEREVVTEEDSTGLTRLIRSTELIARSSESARTYYHYASDEMGSTTHIVDENGNVQNRYEYDAWGKIEVKEEAVPNRFTYYGQQIDPITQQYYLRARFYNPVIGRFTQEDTYRGDGLNLYAYCTNNPVYYADPSGYSAEICKLVYGRVMDGLHNDTLTKLNQADAETFKTFVENVIKEQGEKIARNMGESGLGYITKERARELISDFRLTADDLRAYAILKMGIETKGRHPLLSMVMNPNTEVLPDPKFYLSGVKNVLSALEDIEYGRQFSEASDAFGLLSHTERVHIWKNASTATDGALHLMVGLSNPCQPGCRPALRDLTLGILTEPSGEKRSGVVASGQSVIYYALEKGQIWVMSQLPDGSYKYSNVSQQVFNLSDLSQVMEQRFYHTGGEIGGGWHGVTMKE